MVTLVLPRVGAEYAMPLGMEPTQRQLQQGAASDSMRVLWTGTVGDQRVRITRDLRFDLPSRDAIDLHVENDGDWWLADGGDIEPDALVAALMEAGKLKF